jgi:hypothetical protein
MNKDANKSVANSLVFFILGFLPASDHAEHEPEETKTEAHSAPNNKPPSIYFCLMRMKDKNLQKECSMQQT